MSQDLSVGDGLDHHKRDRIVFTPTIREGETAPDQVDRVFVQSGRHRKRVTREVQIDSAAECPCFCCDVEIVDSFKIIGRADDEDEVGDGRGCGGHVLSLVLL